MLKFMLSLLFLFESAAYASALKVNSGKITFLAKGNPGFMKIEGTSEGKGLSGTLDSSQGKLSGDLFLELKTLSTGMDLRDEHMKDKYLEVSKYPQARLTLKSVTLNPAEDTDGKFNGELTLHGVTKEVNGTFAYEASEKKVNASFILKVSDYAIDIPSWMGVTVADLVEVNVLTELK